MHNQENNILLQVHDFTLELFIAYNSAITNNED